MRAPERIGRDMVAIPKKTQCGYIGIRPLDSTYADKLSRLLMADPPEYTRHFHPFAFTEKAIHEQIGMARRDKYFAVELRDEDACSAQLVGFYMLRGLDEGYKDPMYGVYISAEYSGLGIGHLTLQHAECYCKVNGMTKILLKVHPDNRRARGLYESRGFHYIRDDLTNNNVVLGKIISA